MAENLPVTVRNQLKTSILMAALQEAWCHRVSARTSWPSVSILWLGEIASLTLTVQYHTTQTAAKKRQDPCNINDFNLRYFEGSESFSFILCLLVKTDIQELKIS